MCVVLVVAGGCGRRNVIRHIGPTPSTTTTAAVLQVTLDPAGRPYDRELTAGTAIEVAPLGSLSVPTGRIWVLAGENVPYADTESSTSVDLGAAGSYELGAVWLRESGRRSLAGLVFRVSAGEVVRWDPFAHAYGTDGGMGAVLSMSAIGASSRLRRSELLDRVVAGEEVVVDTDIIVFGNGYGDGAFPLTRGYDASDALARVVIWHLTVPWRGAFGDSAPAPPDVTDYEDELARCLAGGPAPDGYSRCVVAAPVESSTRTTGT